MIAVSHVESSAPTPVSDVEAFEPNLILPLLGCLELLWSLRAGCCRSLLPEPTCSNQCDHSNDHQIKNAGNHAIADARV